MVMVRLIAIALMILGTCSSCSQENKTEYPPHEEFIEELGKLPGLSISSSKELREELARLIGEKAIPELIVTEHPQDENNAAVVLAKIYTEAQLKRISAKVDKLFPSQGKFAFNQYKKVELNQFVKQQQPALRQIQEALSKPACDFGIDFKKGYYGYAHQKNPFLTVMNVCVKLQSFAAAKQLYIEKDPVRAVSSVNMMFRLVRLLAKEKHPIPRIYAAKLRFETLQVVQAIAQHPTANRQILSSLYQILNHELIHWPDDRDAWVGDRCFGLHLYEVARNGNLTALLTENEKKQFETEGILKKLDDSVLYNIDEDQAFYLRAMRAIIDHSSDPYPQRLKIFDQLNLEADQLRKDETFPMIAVRILISDEVENGMLRQVMDRERCEAWRIGLAIASGSPVPKNQINIHSGEKYQVVVNQKLQRVEIGGLRDQDDVPLPPFFIPLKK